MQTRLQFDEGHYITVDEDLGEVESAFRTVPLSAAPLVALNKKGERILVNASQVRFLEAEPQYETATFS